MADIFREQWADYRRNHPVTPEQAKVVGSMMASRTRALAERWPLP